MGITKYFTFINKVFMNSIVKGVSTEASKLAATLKNQPSHYRKSRLQFVRFFLVNFWSTLFLRVPSTKTLSIPTISTMQVFYYAFKILALLYHTPQDQADLSLHVFSIYELFPRISIFQPVW